jgi:PAS domain S-box-containing protein
MIEPASLVAAVEQAADAVVLTDLNGIIQYVNPAFTKITGYAGEEAIGLHTRILKSGR